MSQNFKCPNCGAPLDAPENDESTLRCPFCNGSVIVPEELRKHTAPDLAAVFTQMEETSQEALSTADSNRYSQERVVAVQKAVRRSKTASTCSAIGITAAILLIVGVFVVISLVQPGEPLERLWDSINPSAYARLGLEFGSEGTGPGLFNDARAIAVDNSNGHIYVADYEGGRVQAFDSAGKYLSQWNVGNRKTLITSMTADHKGAVYVTADGKLLRYDGATGKLLGEVPHASSDLEYYDFAVAAADGGLAAIDTNSTIVRLDSDFNSVFTLPDAINTISGNSELDTRLAVDGAGDIYAMGLFNDAVFKFGSDGKFTTQFGSEGDQPGQFEALEAIAVNGKGQVFISDINGIQVFGADGRYIRSFNVPAVAFGMVFTDQGTLLIVMNNEKVIEYTFKQ